MLVVFKGHKDTVGNQEETETTVATFLATVSKLLTKTNLREKGLMLASSLRDYSPLRWERRAARE